MANNNNIGELSEDEFNAIRRLVYDSIGVNLTDAKRALVVSRLSNRLRELDMNSFSKYIKLLERDKKELNVLFNRITTNVTKFFREDHHFDYLTGVFLPALEASVQKRDTRKKIRAWSAGCATGEEPYTIAMVLDNYFRGKKGWDIKIMASDINTETLDKAKKGIYTRKEVEGIPYEFLKRYFKMGTGVNEGKFKAKDTLQKLIDFRLVNLTDSKEYPIADSLHFMFCRNVFIYFNKETQQRILGRYYSHLIGGGLLFIGHSESINTAAKEAGSWKLIKHTIYEKV